MTMLHIQGCWHRVTWPLFTQHKAPAGFAAQLGGLQYKPAN